MIHSTTERISLRDGTHLTAQFFMPANAAHGGVLILAAMGASQTYYAAFAMWLAQQGYVVGIFDYRGIGLSISGPLSKIDLDILDWAQDDCRAMLDALQQRASDRPLFVIGHSLGAQILGLIPNRHLVDGALLIASGSGYWKNLSAPTRRGSLLMWYVLAPLFTTLLGYFPGKRLRIVGDLPRRVVLQWRRWCLHPRYLLGVEDSLLTRSYDAIRIPMLSLSFVDDEMMSAASTELLHGFYAGARIDKHRIAPPEIGVKQIGHFGFFRKQFETTLWPRVTRWLSEQAATADRSRVSV